MEEWSVTFVSEGGANTLHTKKKPEKKPSNPDDRSGPGRVRICRPGYLALQTEKRREKKRREKTSNPDDRSGPGRVRICRPGYLFLVAESWS
jgi:hypothetical protein